MMGLCEALKRDSSEVQTYMMGTVCQQGRPLVQSK